MIAMMQRTTDEIKVAIRNAFQCSAERSELHTSVPTANAIHERLAWPQIQTISGAAPYRNVPPNTLRINPEAINHQCHRGTPFGQDQSPPSHKLTKSKTAT